MEKDRIFFSDSGLTKTSANHISDMAKESYQMLEAKLRSITLYSTEISLLGVSQKDTLKEGVSKEFLDSIQENLLEIAKLKSLIAWLREAIKASDNLIAEVRHLSNTEIANILGITMPEAPCKYPRISKDDIVASWGIKQRNRYYYLGTVCSTIGKYIHPDSPFADAKEDFARILTKPHKASINGRDTIIYTYTPTVEVEDVENTFFALQEKHREFEAELNSMNYLIQKEIQKDDLEKSAKEVKEAKEYSTAINQVLAQIELYRKQELAKIYELRIVIPDSLKSVYERVNKRVKKD